jgi:Spy/CpxP family protein refolding chaperone
MKRLLLIKTAVLTGLVLLGMNPSAIAQKGYNYKLKSGNPDHKGACVHHEISDLTEEQEAKIKELKTAHMKDMLKYNNELNEKHAKLKTLQTAESVEMDKVNKVIEDIGLIKTEMAKERAALHQEIRKLLTLEQRIHFDTKTLYDRRGYHGEMPGYHKGCQRQKPAYH